MKANESNLAFFIFFLIILMISTQSCSPIFSELQSARMAGKDHLEVSPGYTSVNGDDGEGKIQSQAGLQVAYGLTDFLDIRARYENAWIDDFFDDGVSVVGLGPKVSIIEDIIAFYSPVGRAFGSEYEDSWELHPTFLFTLPAVPQKLDLTFAPKYLIRFNSRADNLVALNAGASFSPVDLDEWAIRAEYGILLNPGESGSYGQFSLGFSYNFNLGN